MGGWGQAFAHVSHSPALPRPRSSPSWHTRYVSAARLPQWGQSAGRTHVRIRSAHRPCLRPHPPAPQTKHTPLPPPLHPRLLIRRAAYANAKDKLLLGKCGATHTRALGAEHRNLILCLDTGVYYQLNKWNKTEYEI